MPKDLFAHPALTPYRDAIRAIGADRFPSPAVLQALLDSRCQTHTGHAVTFVSSEKLSGEAADTGYEEEIGRSGRVSTRPNSLHDLCNALVWAVFPQLKAMLNHRHLQAPVPQDAGRRGPVRDALTGFDECGAIAISPVRDDLERLARHDWPALFGPSGGRWPGTLHVVVVGHGTLEMLWDPYKAMTCRCLLLHTQTSPDRLGAIDRLAARLWREDGPLSRPADLCPLPIMGIPGWWRGEQDSDFWEDPTVFRPPGPKRRVPPVYDEDD